MSSLFRQRDFSLVFTADAISKVGTQVTLIALPLVAIKTLHVSKFEVGLLTALETAAFLLVGLPAGALVDRMRRRSVLIAGDLGRAALLASIPIAWWLGALTIWQLYVVALAAGILTVFFDVAYQSYLPHLVGRDRLVEGNAKLTLVESIAGLAGPSAGGFLIQILTAPFALALDAVSYLVSAACVGLVRKREPRPVRGPDAHLGREIAEGVRYVAKHPLLRAIAGCTATWNLFGSIGMAMTIVLFADELHMSAGLIGVFFSITAVGGLVGSWIAGPFVKRFGQGPTIWLAGGFIPAPLCFVLPFAEADWRFWAAAVANAGTWMFGMIYNIT